MDVMLAGRITHRNDVSPMAKQDGRLLIPEQRSISISSRLVQFSNILLGMEVIVDGSRME